VQRYKKKLEQPNDSFSFLDGRLTTTSSTGGRSYRDKVNLIISVGEMVAHLGNLNPRCSGYPDFSSYLHYKNNNPHISHICYI